MRVGDVRLRRQILAEAWSRPPVAGTPEGPTDEERQTLSSLRRGRHAPWLGDTDPIPLLALAQLYSRDVLGLAGPDGCDLLQVFWCPFDAHGEDRTVHVHLQWRRADDVVDPLQEMPEPEVVGSDDYVPDPCIVYPEQVIEHEYAELLPSDLRNRIEEWENRDAEEAPRYQYDLSIPPGWKVGGFASWHLTGPQPVNCVCGQSMTLLLTIDSKEWDGGTRSWVPLEDQANMDKRNANTPTQVAVGRWGALRVFACPADATHPHRLSLQ